MFKKKSTKQAKYFLPSNNGDKYDTFATEGLELLAKDVDLELFAHEIESTILQKKPVQTRRHLSLRRLSLVAASFLLICLFGVYTSNINYYPSISEISHLDCALPHIGEMEDSANHQSTYRAALKSYNARAYTEAIALFQQLSEFPESKGRLYFGFALLKSGLHQQSNIQLEQLLKEDNTPLPYIHNAKYYKALNLLHLKKKKEAITILNELKSSSIKNQVDDLLDKIM